MTTPTALEIHTNAFGVLQHAGVHDATLTALEFRDNALALEWRSLDGNAFRFELGHVHDLRAADFLGQQILSDISVWPLADASKAALIPAEAWRTLYSSTLHFDKIPAAATAAIIKHAAASFVLCEFSYGGDIAVIGDELRLYSLPMQ